MHGNGCGDKVASRDAILALQSAADSNEGCVHTKDLQHIPLQAHVFIWLDFYVYLIIRNYIISNNNEERIVMEF